jgi:hypothetical protein
MARNWRYWIPLAFAILAVGWCGYMGFQKWSAVPPTSAIAAIDDPLGMEANRNVLAGIDFARVWPVAIPIIISLLVLAVAAGREWGLTAIGALGLVIFTFASGMSVGQAYAPAEAGLLLASALGAMLE